MRKDMKKVICESPRGGSHACYREVRRRENRGDLEDLPSCQGMRRPYVSWHGDNAKEFTDHIMPLYRYLWSCLGRRFDDVWSEICATVPSNNTVDQHLKSHIDSELTINVKLIDGELVEHSRWGTLPVQGLYVDPRDGLIHATAPDRDNANVRHYRTPAYDPMARLVKPLCDALHAVKINGIWYNARVEVVPPTRQVTYVEDGEIKVKTKPESRFDVVNGFTVWSGKWYYASKQQMSSRDLRRHRLAND